MSVKRGSTPVHIFKTSIDLTEAVEIYITYTQAGHTIVEKSLSDCTVTAEQIEVRLTQEETLKFDARYSIKIQVRAKYADETAIVSNIIKTDVGVILKDGVI